MGEGKGISTCHFMVVGAEFVNPNDNIKMGQKGGR